MPKTLVGFGASSMEGIGDDERGGFFNRLQPAFDHYAFINLGIGGNTTVDMLHRAGQLESYRPYDLIVLLGCNDYPRANDANPQIRTSLEDYAQNLSRLLPAIRGQRSIFITSFQVDPVRSGVSAELFERYISRAHTIAAQSGYEIIDLYSLMKATECDYLAADGVHFNAQGHQVIADLVQKVLQVT